MAEPGDTDAVVRLLAELHGVGASDRYEWLYVRNPHGKALTWVAVQESSRDVVGVTSVFPRLISVGGITQVGALGGDCYVLPAVRGQRIATRLHVATRDGMARHGVRVMFGPPLPINLKALVAAGARVVTEFRRFATVLRVPAGWSSRALVDGRVQPGAFRLFASAVAAGVGRLSRAIGVPDLGGYSLSSLTAFGSEWDEWSEATRREFPVTCVRDRRYLTWRYLQSPGRAQEPYAVRHDGRLVGLVALEQSEGRCRIVDLFVGRSPQTIRAALALAVLKAAEHECHTVDFWCTEFPGHRRELGGVGFFRRDARAPWKFQVLHAGGTVPDTLLEGRRNWYFTYGDQDVN
ncbi:MAG TPA: hypothetical protein VNL98_06630 [Gemmatimonadales bacterium]|nr:hypothetical protein [Gemmatimonadales bacterium]